MGGLLLAFEGLACLLANASGYVRDDELALFAFNRPGSMPRKA